MPVAVARSRAVSVCRSAEKASIIASTRRAPSQPRAALASGGIRTAAALAIALLVSQLAELLSQQTILTVFVYRQHGLLLFTAWGSSLRGLPRRVWLQR